MTIISLGRYGDIISQLPVVYARYKSGGATTFVVADEFLDLFDGVSYCSTIRYSGRREELTHVIGLCREIPDLRVAQVDRNPDQSKRERSYAIEGYRLGGFRDLWRKSQLVFDRRDPQREESLLARTIKSNQFILVNTKGESSPFANSEQLINGLQSRFPYYQIVDLSKVRGERIYDLLGLMDRAACLVTIDTATLWLANTAKCPVVALVNNGWRGSPSPTTATATFRYLDFQIDQVCDEVEKTLLPTGDIVGIVDRFGMEKRHIEAFKSQEEAFDLSLTTGYLDRDARSIGDSRPLPMLKEMMAKAIKFSSGRDIIVWTNDDVKILDLAPVVDHVRRFGVVGVRRDPAHIGRELFAFRWDWLADRLYNFPDCVVASPWFDLAVAAWIRRQFGWVSDMDNLGKDFYPCEIPNDGILHHPDHPSSWTGSMEAPASKWNERIFKMML